MSPLAHSISFGKKVKNLRDCARAKDHPIYSYRNEIGRPYLNLTDGPNLGHTAYEDFRAHTPSLFRSVQHERLVSMAKHFTSLTAFSFQSPWWPDPGLQGHFFIFLNCLLSLEDFQLLLVPKSFATSSKDDLECGGIQVAASYKKFARIARSKGDNQQLKFFSSEDYAPSDLSVDIPGIIDQEPVG